MGKCVPKQVRSLGPQIPIVGARYRGYHFVRSPSKEDVVLNEKVLQFTHYQDERSVDRLLDSLIERGFIKDRDNVFLGIAVNILACEITQNIIHFWPLQDPLFASHTILEELLIRAFYYNACLDYGNYQVVYSVSRPNSNDSIYFGKTLGTITDIIKKYEIF